MNVSVNKKNFLTYFFISICIFIFLFIGKCFAQNTIGIENIGIDNSNSSLSVGFSIKTSDSKKIINEFQSGQYFIMNIDIHLYEKRSFIWNKNISSVSKKYKIYSDQIARECFVVDSTGKHSFHFANLATDLNEYWEKVSIPVISWSDIERNNEYFIQIVFSVKKTDFHKKDAKSLFFLDSKFIPEIIYELQFEY